MASVFDEDTRVERMGDGLYRGAVSDRFSIGPVPNGGYALCIAARAMLRELDAPDPISVTGHYLRPTEPGSVEISVETVKRGRRYATAAAKLVQSGRECLRVLGTFGDLGDAHGPEFIDGAPPDLPPLDQGPTPRLLDRLPEIAKRFEMITAPETMRWMDGERGDKAEVRAAMRFSDGRPADTLSLLLFADALAPAVFNVLAPGWVPTLELTVHCRARPSPGWLKSVFRTRFVSGGHLDEDGELWDEAGRLVAMSRQLAGVPRTG